MTKSIVAFGASNSKKSINKKLAEYAAGKVPDTQVDILDLNDFEMPIYSIDRELENGIPELASNFKNQISNSDGVIISFAEHNGSYSVAFKNVLDWVSRIDKDIWANKPMFLLSTSPGGRGGMTVLNAALSSIQRINNNTIVSFSLPSFHKNFSAERKIINPELEELFNQQLHEFESAVFS